MHVWIEIFLETSVKFLHNLIVLQEVWYYVLVKLVAILYSPPIEVINAVAEDGVHNLVLKFLIMICNTLCGSSDQHDIYKRTVHHRV